jgi:OOP family OmpA-OmpF porin
MPVATKRQAIGLLMVALSALALPSQPVRAQAAAPGSNLADQLVGPETPADLDVAALRQQVTDRVQSKAEANPLKRPPIAPQLLKLPQVTFDIMCDPDTPVLRPQSYPAIGLIADALADPKLRAYAYLVVDHTESTGRRAPQLALSQRRADAIRSILAGTFNISSKRLQSLGLGEEQLQDVAKPASPANVRVQIVAIGTAVLAPPVAPAATASGVAPAKKKSPGSAKRH